MAIEIERKFLVRDSSYKECASTSFDIAQGYLCHDKDRTIRIRIKGDRGFIAVKSKNNGASRNEWEYEIPVSDAQEMLSLCPSDRIISKKRYIYGRWEIDEFKDRLNGLTVAEIELDSPDEQFECPSFIGREVTGDIRYYNSVLSTSSELPPLV